MRVLNFGSLNLDFVYQVEHFVRPGETLGSESLQTFAGGKGLNQSVALCRAGAEVFHAGCVGEDGGLLLQTLREAGADISLTQTLPGVRTGHAIIQVDASGQNCILLFGGANRAVPESCVDRALKPFGAGDWLLLQNETAGLARLMEQGKARGMKIAVNPSPISPELLELPLSLADLFFVNETEGAALSGETEPERILSAMREKFPKASIVLTLGKDGAAFDDGRERLYQPIFPVRAADTTAAGDTFTGFFLCAWGGGMDSAGALLRASAASAIAVTRMGASPSIPTAAEVEHFLKENAR